MSAVLFAVHTRTGSAIHARTGGHPRTLCGCKASPTNQDGWRIGAPAIAHPLACDRCNRVIRTRGWLS